MRSTVQFPGGKLKCRDDVLGRVTAVNNKAHSSNNSNLLFVKEIGRDIELLVDTGASLSVVPQSFSKKKRNLKT